MMISELPENVSDMGPVKFEGFGVYQDVIEIDNDEYVNILMEDIVDEVLEGSRSVGQTEWHHQILIASVSGSEGGLPFIAFSDADEVVGTSEVYLGKNLGCAELFKEWSNERNRIAILLGDSVELPIINAESKFGSVLLSGKEDWSSDGRRGRSDETFRKIFVDVLAEFGLLVNREIVYGSDRRKWLTGNVDAMVIRPSRRQLVRLGSRKNVHIVVVFLRDSAERILYIIGILVRIKKWSSVDRAESARQSAYSGLIRARSCRRF